jgi:hypothetical protein
MLTAIEEKFRAGVIDKVDRAALKQIIIDTKNESDLESALYIFGRSGPLDPTVLKICIAQIESPKPGLTAVCMRTAFDYWDRWEDHKNILSSYVNIALYAEWYDEVLFASRFCAKLSKSGATNFFDSRLAALRHAAALHGHDDLVQLIDS